MKQKKIIVGALLLGGIACLFGFAKFDDDDIIKKIATQLNAWTLAQPQEKVYLHLDKPYYAVGDEIWFKAYVTAGDKHQLSTISGLLNVELINSEDSIKKQLKVPLTYGLGWGSIKLTDSLKEGNYRIRAYTNWMRNAGDEYFFDKTIQVGNSISNTVFTKVTYNYASQNNQQKVSAIINYADIDGKPYTGKDVSYEVQLDNRTITKGKGITDDKGNINLSFVNNTPTFKSGSITTRFKLNAKQEPVVKTLPIKATSAKVDVQFFPESGNLVAGVRSKVAFKAVGADGLGVDIKGAIFDTENNEIVKITTQHLGMGVFTLIPEAGKTYVAKVTYPDGSEGTVALPVVATRGYVLSVYNSNENDITLRIAASDATFQENQNNEISLVAQSGGAILYAAKTKLSSAVFATRVPRSRFPSGIVQFTLFSAKGEALNERIIFIQNAPQLNIALTTAKAVYTTREKVKMSIAAKNSAGQPVTGAFSVSVIDETKVPVDESNENTILASMLLSSDIKGYIEKPNYYFANVNEKTTSDLDLLMLTQGYRRFEWKQIMAGSFSPPIYPSEKSLNITGNIKTPGGKPIPRAKVTLLTTTGGIFMVDTVADEQGHFAFKNLVFTDSVKFVVQARTEKGRKNVEIELTNVLPQSVTKNRNQGDVEVNISSNMAAYLINSKRQYDDFLKYGLVTRSSFLKEVTISEKKEVLKYSSNLNGVGNADQVVKSDQLDACATLTQCLLGKINFVNFRNGVAYSTRSPNIPMLIVVDGMQMDSDFLDQLSPSNVESVEVLRTGSTTAIYGSQGGGGVLVVTTKRGEPNYGYKRYAPGIITYSPIGYERTRQFYSPQYDNPKTNKYVADLRTTIYWNPNIITDKSGLAGLDFFNADSPGTYRAVIEGIDNDGNIGRQVYRYKVQ
ncbi:TonB-dependent SusC/RagA subfamily outer membrane receptor [Mucilaginibacter gracilis]|uniref:TonB-dependent SusC/RagA subfamily outer membrane receptor n=1 Tax=Mucilaginibacter gracilis TaxID=423350 RepID=A0A495J9X6_9SPHI|nr:TonB-dependent receptor plug domain-containing protein [Mucilaginibacter gracilis]RKR85613.1 TonB-dependent SusC/RagA subfamily outer membrane receptor [Mucilaginibacter gracilis]